ncbi:MAG: hypothetical protein EXS12_03635 [Phycisphaerales bacterium]|nr:hypothetical protein [Phycisphaerales bacterium]
MMALQHQQHKLQPQNQSPAWLSVPAMRYQDGYVWFVLLASLDIILTWYILLKGGMEVNPVAKVVIDRWDIAGAIAFKFSLVLFVVVACEIVGRHQDKLGKRLILCAMFISAFPVLWSLTLLFMRGFLIYLQPQP